MKKSEFLTQRTKIEKELSDLRAKYIKANQRFKKGDKVLITRADNSTITAFVSMVYLSNDTVRYKFSKIKKDGSPSAHSPIVWSDDKITLIGESLKL